MNKLYALDPAKANASGLFCDCCGSIMGLIYFDQMGVNEQHGIMNRTVVFCRACSADSHKQSDHYNKELKHGTRT